MKIILVLSLIIVACSARRLPRLYGSNETDPAIVGGFAAKAGEVPWIAALFKSDQPWCDGSIFDERTILTAAHCVDNIPASHFKIRVGSLKISSGGTLIQINKVVQHKSYDPDNSDYDIALLKTSADIPIDGKDIVAIQMPVANSDPASGEEVLVAGWGALKWQSEEYPEHLQRVNVNIISRSTCNTDYGGGITSRMICAGVKAGGKDACQGDSGGPLTVGTTQHGIVSWGNECALKHYPGVYTRLSLFVDWVNENK